jgi:Right handed beta helix region
MAGRHRQFLMEHLNSSRRPKRAAGILAAYLLVAVIGIGGLGWWLASGSPSHSKSQHSAAINSEPSDDPGPSSPPVRVCGNKTILGTGPTTVPSGAVTVPAGDDSGFNFNQPHTIYWFASGTHILGAGQYTQIIPGSWSTYIGAPGAVLDGQHKNVYAFGGYAVHVTISYLTIENFGTEGGNQNQGVVNEDSAADWTIDHSTIAYNGGAGAMLGSDNTLSYDCLEDNGQYGFNAYSPSGPAHLVLDHNEITGNDTYNWEARQPGCGCTGGGKFWAVNGAVIDDNWIHDNHSAGLWADTDNRSFQIKGNYISDNYSYGLIYEISYNALIQDNTFARNGLGEGPTNQGFPTSAIYISESGSDRMVAGKFNGVFSISDNTFLDNWGGVILWENSNRFCNSPANTSTGSCTLVNPRQVTIKSCSRQNVAHQPYYSECRWKTQNVLVSHNVFDFDPDDIGSSCTPANECGFQGVFSEYGTYPSWSPYLGTIVEQHITFKQNNHFVSNVYNGPWEFMADQQGDVVTWTQWQGSPYGQDKGSTLNTSAS